MQLDPVNYGMGIVCFPESINVDQDLIIPYLSALKEKAIKEDYTIVQEKNGGSYAINRSGHRYLLEDIEKSASHIMDFINRDTEKEVISFFQDCENIIYKSLLRYIEIYPMILRNIWWKTLGHVLAYGPGSDMGLHNDNDVNYQPDFEPDLQLATRNVVGAIIYLNSSVQDKKDIIKHEYNSGEIFFPYANVKYTPKSGDILMFPSNYLGTHEIHPCLNGSRYAYIGYFAQGSSHFDRGIFVTEESLPTGKQGQVWVKSLREDYISYILNKYKYDNLEFAMRDPKLQVSLRGTIIRPSSSGTKESLPHKMEKNEK